MLNKCLNNAGGFMRNRSHLKLAMRSFRKAWHRRLLANLKLVPMFHSLSDADLSDLAGKMHRCQFRAGATIFARVCATLTRERMRPLPSGAGW